MGSLDEATRIGTINPQAIAKICQRWLIGSPRRTVLRGRLGNVFLFNQQEFLDISNIRAILEVSSSASECRLKAPVLVRREQIG